MVTGMGLLKKNGGKFLHNDNLLNLNDLNFFESTEKVQIFVLQNIKNSKTSHYAQCTRKR